VRIGTAEIYRQLETINAVQDAVVVGQPWEGDVRIVLFVVLAAGTSLDPALEQQIRQTIRAGATPRHVPSVILAVPDVPRTLSGKIAEKAVLHTLLGKRVSNRDALANPDSLAAFEALLPQLKAS
jgi:acetoacetyl-CoA synthetase